MPVNHFQLLQNESLGPDQSLSSLNGRYTFFYQGDGNLVLYKNYRNRNRKPIWASGTDGRPAGNCVMQGDGNLVIYGPTGEYIWDSATDGHQGSRLDVQDDGNVVIYRSDNTPIWATNTVQALVPTGATAHGSDMHPGEVLNPEQSLSSANGQYYLVYQDDGNLVLYRIRDGKPLWASGTHGRPAEVCIMQGDGNLVIYGPDGEYIWDTATDGHPGSRLNLQDDGNLVVYSSNNIPIWATNTNQPAPSSTIHWPWAIILCRFSDVPAAPQNADYYVDLFTRNGTGGMCDYWRIVSCNALDLTGSRVFGWLTMNHSSSEVSQLHFPGDRSKLVQWGIDAARANGVNLSPFKSILVVQNFGVDHGAAGNGILIVHQNATLCEFGFICHEMGHGMGLPHSFAAKPDMEYGDGWDLMSFATTTFQFPLTFKRTNGDATVGLNARNLEALNAVPLGRMWVQTQPDFSEQIALDPLNQAPIGNHGFLIAKIAPNATRPRRSNNSSFTIEFRRRAGWDRAIPQDAVLIHEVRNNGLSYLQPTIWGQFTVGQQFVTPDPQVFVQVVNIDRMVGIATVRLWDLPEGSLRKEDSKPRVYLIENGTKRWVTSPQVLFALGKTWADVRVVPDGALNNIPLGSDVL